MKKLSPLTGCLLWLFSASSLSAQFAAPAPPAVPAVPAAPAALPAATPAAAAGVAQGSGGNTIWSYLGLTYENHERHRQHFCKKPIGQLFNSMLKPFTFATGGLIPPICPPTPSEDELKKLLDPNNPNVSEAEAAAAGIKAQEANAKARRAAVRYLGTVDCHYFPEAEGALISALRGDTNECVRFEAALALSRGCCCTKKTVAALTLAASGRDTDGNPGETSQRVQTTAMIALNQCVTRLASIPDEPERPELPPESEAPPVRPEVPASYQNGGKQKSKIQLTAYYTQYLPRVSRRRMLRDAALVLAASAGNANSARHVQRGQRGLLQILSSSNTSSPADDEIAFDEAALQVPVSRQRTKAGKSMPMRTGKSIQSKTLATTTPDALQTSFQQPSKSTQSHNLLQKAAEPVRWPGAHAQTSQVKTVSYLRERDSTVQTAAPAIEPVSWPGRIAARNPSR